MVRVRQFEVPLAAFLDHLRYVNPLASVMLAVNSAWPVLGICFSRPDPDAAAARARTEGPRETTICRERSQSAVSQVLARRHALPSPAPETFRPEGARSSCR